MDPNAALDELIKILCQPAGFLASDKTRTQELLDALCDWRANGGFAPEAR